MDKNNINIPNHVAIIMDGNGRWATKRGLKRSAGHFEGSKTLEKTGLYILKKGVKVLSVFAFSTENFKRPSHQTRDGKVFLCGYALLLAYQAVGTPST